MNPFQIAGMVWVLAAAATMVYQTVCRRRRSRDAAIEVTWKDCLTSSVVFGFLFAVLAFCAAGLVTSFL